MRKLGIFLGSQVACKTIFIAFSSRYGPIKFIVVQGPSSYDQILQVAEIGGMSNILNFELNKIPIKR